MIRANVMLLNPPKAIARNNPAIVSHALEEAVDFRHERHLPGHFTTAASARYRYKRRSKAHNRRKQRLYGHQKDLVFSGDMSRELTASITIRSTRGRTTGSMTGPAYLYKRPANSPDKVAEILATTSREERETTKIVEADLQQGLDTLDVRERKPLA